MYLHHLKKNKFRERNPSKCNGPNITLMFSPVTSILTDRDLQAFIHYLLDISTCQAIKNTDYRVKPRTHRFAIRKSYRHGIYHNRNVPDVSHGITMKHFRWKFRQQSFPSFGRPTRRRKFKWSFLASSAIVFLRLRKPPEGGFPENFAYRHHGNRDITGTIEIL